MRPKLLSDVLLIIVTVVWGMNFAVMKAAYVYFDPLAFTALRFIVAASALLIIFKLRGIPLGVERRDLPALTGLGLLGNTVYQVFFVFGLAETRAGNASLLVSTAPVFAYLTGVALKREAFSRRVLAGILLSMAGVAVVMVFGPAPINLGSGGLGDVLILMSAICWGFYTGAAARLIIKYGALRLTLWALLTGTLAMIPLLAPYLLRQDWSAIPLQGWLGFFYSALLAIVFGYVAWSYALEHLGVSRTAVYSNVTPLIALMGSWMTLGERPVLAQFEGIAMILGGVVLVRGYGGTLAFIRAGIFRGQAP
jgi:drug/metabolite transporter (DMT)-like permease